MPCEQSTLNFIKEFITLATEKWVKDSKYTLCVISSSCVKPPFTIISRGFVTPVEYDSK